MDHIKNAASGESAHPASCEDGSLSAYQELWFALSEREWTSVVLVPADPGASAASVGNALAEIGTRLSEIPVTAISVSSVGYESAFALADLQQHVERARRAAEQSPVINVTPTEVGETVEGEDDNHPADTVPGDRLALGTAGTARLVISIPAVVAEPLGLAATQVADAIVLTIEMGRTKIADARRTIELIGRERIAGCFLVR
jgi:hypothetical protein